MQMTRLETPAEVRESTIMGQRVILVTDDVGEEWMGLVRGKVITFPDHPPECVIEAALRWAECRTPSAADYSIAVGDDHET